LDTPQDFDYWRCGWEDVILIAFLSDVAFGNIHASTRNFLI